MFQLKNRQSNALEMGIQTLKYNLKLNKMSIITNAINDFLKEHDGKESIPVADFYNLRTQISFLENGSKNLQEGFIKIFGGNVLKDSDIDLSDSKERQRLKKIITDSIENNATIIGSNSIIIETKINEILKFLSGLSYEDCLIIINIAKEKLKQKSILHT